MKKPGVSHRAKYQYALLIAYQSGLVKNKMRTWRNSATATKPARRAGTDFPAPPQIAIKAERKLRPL
jgi:hypothetical protein